MIRVIRFVLDTREIRLKLEPILDNENWDLVVYSDSDCAGDVENRISVTGFIIYLLGFQFVGDQKVRRGDTVKP
jgi:hypothetical protein